MFGLVLEEKISNKYIRDRYFCTCQYKTFLRDFFFDKKRNDIPAHKTIQHAIEIEIE